MANELDKLCELMKEKLKVSNKRENIQILTLTPDLGPDEKLRKNSKFLRPQLERLEY